jgi:pimeloyl-ACP methyl ester carboxylesterase
MEYTRADCTSVDGTRIAYGSAGSGDPLVVITSWATSIARQLDSDANAPFYAPLVNARRVLLPARRGVGESQRLTPSLSMDAQVADVLVVMAAEGIGRCDLLGDNDGCYVAVSLAAAHPERVRRLALWAPLVTGEDARPGPMREFAQLMRDDWPEACRQWGAYGLPDGPEPEVKRVAAWFDAHVSRETAAQYMEWEAGEDVSALLSRVTAPTLALNTRRGGSRSMGVASLMPDARFEPVDTDPGTGGLDLHALGRRIAEFLENSR